MPDYFRLIIQMSFATIFVVIGFYMVYLDHKEKALKKVMTIRLESYLLVLAKLFYIPQKDWWGFVYKRRSDLIYKLYSKRRPKR